MNVSEAAATARVPWGRRLSLAGVLACALGAELLLNRLAARLVKTDLVLPRPWIIAIDAAGLFAFHLASVLGVAVIVLALLHLLVQPPEGAPRSAAVGRAVTLIMFLGFAAIAGLGVVRQLPDRLLVYMLALFTFLAFQLTVAVWPALRGRLRVWLTGLVLALLLHLVWVVARVLRVEDATAWPRLSLQIGEAFAVTLAAASPFALPSPGRSWRRPAIAGVVAISLTLVAAFLDFSLVARVADGGFGLEVPLPGVGRVLYALATGALVAAVVVLMREPGPSRLRGLGLLLIALSGYQLELPFQVTATLAGMLCIVDSALRENGIALDTEGWQRLVREVAVAVGAREVTLSGRPGFEEMRARALVDGAGVEIMLQRAAGRPALLDLAVGYAPTAEAPPVSLQARGATRLGRREGLEVRTGDVAFDDAVAVFDTRRLDRADPLLSDDLRPRLRAQVDGWLGIWPGRGARLRTAAARFMESLAEGGPAAEGALRERVALLIELERRG